MALQSLGHRNTQTSSLMLLEAAGGIITAIASDIAFTIDFTISSDTSPDRRRPAAGVNARSEGIEFHSW
jgi:hypothetical protein